jgi:hypothetical protein
MSCLHVFPFNFILRRYEMEWHFQAPAAAGLSAADARQVYSHINQGMGSLFAAMGRAQHI